jgi:hypothetical protein
MAQRDMLAQRWCCIQKSVFSGSLARTVVHAVHSMNSKRPGEGAWPTTEAHPKFFGGNFLPAAIADRRIGLQPCVPSGRGWLVGNLAYKTDRHSVLPSFCTALVPVQKKGHAPGTGTSLYDISTAHAYAAYDRVGFAFSRSTASCGSANCVRDAPQPQPHPQLSSPARAVSDNGEGASIVKGSKVEVGIASPFRSMDMGCGS